MSLDRINAERRLRQYRPLTRTEYMRGLMEGATDREMVNGAGIMLMILATSSSNATTVNVSDLSKACDAADSNGGGSDA